MENVAKKIVIDQVELSTLIATLEGVVNNVVSLIIIFFGTSNFTTEIKDDYPRLTNTWRIVLVSWHLTQVPTLITL